MKTVPDSHPYFSDMLQFAQIIVANLNSLMLMAASRTIHDLVDAIKEMVKSGNPKITGQVNDHSMMEAIYLADRRCPDAVKLHEADQIYGYMTGLRNEPVDRICYELTPYTESEKNQPGRITREGSDPSRRFQAIVAYLVGGAYERYKEYFENRYGKNPQNWDPQLQFFRHMRNGCFHSNTFNITPIHSSGKRGQPQINTSNPPTWRNYVMISDTAMNGTKVIGGFFHIHMTIPFLHDMGGFV